MRRAVRIAVASLLLVAVACAPGGDRGAPGRTSPEASGSPGAAQVEVRPAPVPSRRPAVAARLGPFDADRALAVARRLSDEVGPRPAGSPGEAAARELLAAELRAAGWTVEERPFPLPQGGASANVVAWRPDDPPDRPHVVVGGHLDTVAGSPGANDNGSGIGVLVAVAEEVFDERTPVPAVLVGFGAEEFQPSDPPAHHLGSEAYAAAAADRVLAALSVDMVGNGPVTCICWSDTGPDTLARRLDALADDGSEVRRAGDISDHGPFAHRGIPAALLWTGRDARYHTPRDTAEHLRAQDVRRAGELTLRFLRDLRPEDAGGLRPAARLP